MSKFKIGDWVRHAMDFNTIYQVTKVFEDSIETNDPNNRNFMNESLIYLTDGTEFLRLIGTNFVFKPESIAYETLLKGKSSYPLAILQEGLTHWEEKAWFLQDCELWEPKPGEWCWFWDDDMRIPLLDNFVYNKVDNVVTFTELDSKPYIANISDKAYQYCEPFLGTLPSTVNTRQ